MAQFVKIHAMGDDPCDECEDLDGEIVTRQYWRAHTHPNCKCVATPATKKDMTKAERKIAAKANNMENLENKEENLENTEEIQTTKEINEDGSVDVQVAVTGTIVGSDKDGQPIEQQITEEALQDIAGALNESGKEILVDRDHQSAREGLDRDTHAMGWLSRFWTTTKGLFAKLKLTPTGRELVEGREYRKLSPVFTIDENGKPISLESAAFTNTPAMQDIEPILNQKPNQESTEMTKEEIIELIKATIAEQAKPAEQPKDDIDVDELLDEKPEEKKEEETAENSCAEMAEEQDKPAEEKSEEKIEEKAEEQPEEKKESQEKPAEEQPKPKKKELIDEAVLNQMPTSMNKPSEEWRNLHGADLQRWLYKNGLI